MSAQAFDPRIISTLIPSESVADLAGAAPDVLNRVAATLELLSDLIGSHSWDNDPLGTEDRRFALSLQLDEMAGAIRATGDALGERRGSDQECEQ